VQQFGHRPYTDGRQEREPFGVGRAERGEPSSSPATPRESLFLQALPPRIYKGGPNGQNRTADEPGQTLNVDLCFVPATHQTAQRLPAVSGSSGRLVISGPRPRPRPADPARTWPGQVFDDPETAYDAAMREFVRQSAPRTAARPTRRRRPRPKTEAPATPLTPRQEQRRLDQQRAQVLQQRQQEDAAWQAACRARRAWLRPERWTPSYWRAYLAAEDQWLRLREQRQATLAQRQQDRRRPSGTRSRSACKPPWRRQPPGRPGSRSWS
jgi:hypothetical protein